VKRFRMFGSYLRVGWLGRTEVRLHWAALVLAAVLVVSKLVGLVVGLATLVLMHELGHAYLARRAGLAVSHIEMHPFGGRCLYYADWATPWDRAVIAWGGVLFQLPLLAIGFGIQALPRPDGWLGAQIASVAVVWSLYNLVTIAVNLIPMPPLDGAVAWRLVPMIPARLRAARERRETRAEPTGPSRREVALKRAKARGLRVLDDE